MLPDHLHPEVRAAVAEAKAALEALYGARLVCVVLYGSHARGEAHEGSDVDLLVLLRGPFNDAEELRRIWEAVWADPQDAHPLTLSFVPYSEEAYEDTRRPLTRAVHTDGIML